MVEEVSPYGGNNMSITLKLYMLFICIELCAILLIIEPSKLSYSVDLPTNTEFYLKNPTQTTYFTQLSSNLPIQEKTEEIIPIAPTPPPVKVIIKPKIEKKPESYNMWVTSTAYCPCARCCGRGSPGITKTGRNAWTPGVAIDPRYIPLGSHLDIPGYNRVKNGSWVLCDDTGGKIKGRRIDIRFNYHYQAKQWGKKYIKVRVYPKQSY